MLYFYKIATDRSTKRLTVPGYDVIRSLESGSLSQIVLARDHGDQRIYSAKITKRTLLNSSSAIKQILSEQSCLRAVTERDPPFLPRLLRSFQDDERLYVLTV